MANEWESKQLPRSADGVGPAYWNREENDWMPYEGDTNIVAELESIKETQTEILKRLDDPLDTRLTGSNVELVERKLGYELSAGGKQYVVSTPPNKYNYIIVAVGAENAHDFKLYTTFSTNESEVATTSLIYEINGDKFIYEGFRGYTEEQIQVIGDRAQIRLVNNSDSNQKYDAHVWGVL